MSQQLHEFLLAKLRPGLEKHIGYQSDSETLRSLFLNYRLLNGEHHGLRLTSLGAKVMQKEYDSYRYDMDIKPNHKAFMVLDQNANWPYYIGRKYITYFAEQDAAWYRLNSSNINEYVDYL